MVAAKLRVESRDQAGGHVIPARFYLTDAAGKQYSPAGAITYDKREEHHFISAGVFDIEIPPGPYTLTCERGPEYRAYTTSIEAQAGDERTITVSLVRWIDMNQHGWYSGDLHNHRPIAQMPQLLLADDLNLAPTLTEWIWEDRPNSTAPQNVTSAIQQVDATHVFSVFDEEIERLEQGPGAVDLLGLHSVIPFHGYRLYPPNDEFCKLAQAQHGYVDLEKIVWRDSAALVALGLADFAGVVYNHFNRHNVMFETDPWGMIPKERAEFSTVAGMPLWAMEVYYRFLNCGFRLPVSAGSASGVMAAPLGYNRVYVKLSEPFRYESWFRALKSGRSFGTNGPMLFLTVNGKEPGEELRLPEGAAVPLRIQAGASSAGTLDRLEILFKGRVIKTASARDAQGKLSAEFDFPVRETGWLAARAFEKPGTTIHFAHTSPVYVRRRGSSGLVAQDARYCINWMDREIAFYQKEPGFRSAEDRQAMIAFFNKARAVYENLGRRASA
ncbi:MAG TPA: CehA/McbA family metallohydrolase [Bryobacteraceae bacterium]|nr:CehA/McbA family metallohydrolase [Bryobacteraceae bacterium]